ncbi:MAG: M48 family peptidase, partial [Spirochaetia bacterium]|nr:M48 family peptidase [Spirochaetia bacterium]
MPDILFNLIIFIIITDFVFSYILEYLNYSSWPSKIPETIRDFYSDQKYSEAFYYNQDKYFLSSVSSTFSYIILLGMLYAGGFYYVDEAAGVISNHPITSAILFFIILYAGNEILTLPISYYNTFVIESKYGFNRTKAPLFIKDKIVSFLISSVIISAVISILIFFYEMLGEKSWIISWIIFTVFILLIQYFYTGLIVPLFNKLTPLEEGQLKKKIEEYALKVNFP